MKTSRFWGYFAKVGLGTGVAVALAGAPVVAHAEDNTPSGALQRGSEATGNAATNAGNAASNTLDKAGNAADQAGNAASGAANQAGNAASGAANQASDTAQGAANKASDTAQGAADKAQGAADQAQGAADQAQGAADRASNTAEHGAATDDSSITDAVKTKLAKTDNTSRIKVDTDNGVVTLSGTVRQQSTRDSAVKMAKKTKGVKKVKDDIELAPAQ